MSYQKPYEVVESDKRCWEDVAMKAHLKIVTLNRQLKELREKHEKEIEVFKAEHNSEIALLKNLCME